MVTVQTGPAGLPVGKVLVEEQVIAQHELYLGILIDRSRRVPAIVASARGGVEIEQRARDTAGIIHRTYIDPVTGFQPFHGRLIAEQLNLGQELVRSFTGLAANLYRLFCDKDCSLIEINPLAVTPGPGLAALDAKIEFDDNALFRHPDIAALIDPAQEDPLEAVAAGIGIRNYVKLDGNIGCIVNGAGLAMAVVDLVHLAGGRAANFLDIGTANNAERVVNAFRILTADAQVKVILVNIFGGLARVDVIARGIVDAFRAMKITVPVVVRLAGNNVEEGEQILRESGLDLVRASNMQEAAERAVAAANPDQYHRRLCL